MKVNIYNSLLVAVICTASLTGCTKKLEQENALLKAQVDSLQTLTLEMSESKTEMIANIAYYEKSLRQIDSTLAKIANNQKELSLVKGEVDSEDNTVESISERIQSIQGMMLTAKQKILKLDKNLVELRKQSGVDSEAILALDKKLKAASQELIDKEAEMIALQATLESEIDDLSQDLTTQIQITNELQASLNRVYYYVGESKELKDKGIVNKEGGFIGLGKVKIVNANAPTSLFTEGSKEKLDMIKFSGKDAVLISDHPEGTYEWIGSEQKEGINILNKESFWKDTNYLVIEIK